MKNHLISKIHKNNHKVGIIGLGYVGLPIMIGFANSGINVLGFDIDDNKINSIKKGKSYIKHIKSGDLKKGVKNKHIDATSDFSRIDEVDAIILCLPTPLNKNKEPDISYIISTMDKIKPYLKEGQLLSLESTTYPGTTDELIKPYIENKGFDIGKNFFLVYSPEREDPANPSFTTRTIPKVIGGTTSNCLEIGIAIYSSIIDKMVPVSSTQTAEFTKLLENIYRSVNISMMNEMKMLCDKMGLNIWEIIEAASTKPFGFKAFYPGPGLGGHCIPIDPFYLTWKAKQFEFNTKFIELSGEINSIMPNYIVSKIMDALNYREKSLKGSNILILGLAYKKNVDDPRESPSVKLIKLLKEKGANVSYSDPYIPSFPKMRKYSYDMNSVNITKESLQNYDCAVLVSDHDCFDYDFIHKHTPLIVDTRGRYKDKKDTVVMA